MFPDQRHCGGFVACGKDGQWLLASNRMVCFCRVAPVPKHRGEDIFTLPGFHRLHNHFGIYLFSPAVPLLFNSHPYNSLFHLKQFCFKPTLLIAHPIISLFAIAMADSNMISQWASWIPLHRKFQPQMAKEEPRSVMTGWPGFMAMRKRRYSGFSAIRMTHRGLSIHSVERNP